MHYWEKNYYVKQRKKKMYTETVSRERLLVDDAENMNRTTGNRPRGYGSPVEGGRH